MAGGVLQIVGVVALLIAGCELMAWLFPRRLVDEFREIYGDVPGPRAEPELDMLRRRGVL